MSAETGSLPQRLKDATRAWHARAEHSGVMAHLLAGRLSREAYVALLVNLEAIYRTLEPAVQAQNWPLPLASLARSAALQSDLAAFGAAPAGETPGIDDAAPAPATQDYVQRLKALVGPDAHRLWAHVYVRYLGDLHGGQILSRRVRGLFDEVSDGTRFYDFGSAEQVRALRDDVRRSLSNPELTAAQADEVVSEALWAFEAHCQIFEQIEAGA